MAQGDHHARSREAQALWHIAPGEAELRTEPLPRPGPGDLLIRTLYSGISRGTERLVAQGRVPASETARMRCPHMRGGFPFPVKYGYCLVGVVEEGPPAWHGRTVFLLHPHQSAVVIPAGEAVVIPAAVPPQRAVLAANLETALNAVWDAAASPCDRIAVVGGGVVGLLVAWLCQRLPGAAVTLIDIDPEREALASRLGLAFSLPEAGPGDCDVVFHASASATGLTTALALAGDEATVLEMSWYGTSEVTVPLGGAFHSRRLRLISSQVGRVSPGHRSRWTHARRLAAALALLGDSRLDHLLGPGIAFADLPDKIGGILEAPSGAQCPLIAYADGRLPT